MPAVKRAVNIEDLRRLAIARLPAFVSNYFERGAGDGGGVQRNIAAFRNYRLLPRALVDVTPVDTATELFGRKYSSFFGISAVGTAGIYRRNADEYLAEVARTANIPFLLSGASSASIETIARIAPDHTWYQLYPAKQPDVTDDMIRRARDAGIKVLVLTVDYPLPPRSEVAARTGVSLATGPTLRTFPSLFLDALCHPSWTAEYLHHRGIPALESWTRYAPAGSTGMQVARFYVGQWWSNRTWSEVERVRALWNGVFVVKGLVHPDDVSRAIELGADAVTVSNHGGNKLDCMESTIESLVRVRGALGKSVRLFFDGGIRRGSDFIVARALGADFCFVGRATLYGVAAGGLAGAARAVELLQSDLTYTMAMTGVRTPADITADHVVAAH